MSRREPPLNRKPSVACWRQRSCSARASSSIYRSIEKGDLPIPVFKIAGRYRIPRLAVDRLPRESQRLPKTCRPSPSGTGDRAS